MSLPLISIIIPCYNQGAYLIDSLKSISKQTYNNWECIIVNDGSTDDTDELAEEWCQNHSKFSYFRRNNGGISSARNVGLEKAKGDYIQFLDGDDFLEPKKLMLSIDALQKNYTENKNIVISNFKLFVEETQKYAAPYCYLELEKFNFQSVLLKWEETFTIPIHCGLFEASLLENFRFPEEVRAKEDWLMWIAVFKQNPSVTFIDAPLAVYRRHKKSMTMSSSLVDGHIAALTFLKKNLDDKDYEKFSFATLIRYYESSLYYRQKYNATKKSNTYLLGEFLKRSVDKIGLLKPLKNIFNRIKR